MQTDTNLIFVGSNVSSTSVTIGSASVTSNILDLATGLITTSSTYGQSPLTGGNFYLTSNLNFGEDLGPGALRLRGSAWLSSTFAPNSTSGTTFAIAWQGAPDIFAGSTTVGTFASLTFSTYAQTGGIPIADLSTGSAISLPDWPDRMVKTNLPRFMRLAFIPSGTFSSLTIVFAGISTSRPDLYIGQYVGGFQVAS